MLRVTRHARHLHVRNVVDRVAGSRIDGVLRRAVVDLPARLVEHHVFQNRTESDCVEDLGLGLLGEIDALGVATAFDVEDAFVTPAVLVVADETPPRVGRESRLPGPGEAEEERDLSPKNPDSIMLNLYLPIFISIKKLIREYSYNHQNKKVSNQHKGINKMRNI